MISAALQGGLGNQMFQIATTYAVALDNNDECGFNFYHRLKRRNVSGDSPSYYRDNIYSKLKSLPDNWEHDYLFDSPNWDTQIPYTPNMLLTGYLCNPVYFNHRKKEITNLFKHSVEGNFKNSVAVHVRRGNYVLKPECYVLPISYYIDALQYIKSNVQVDVVYIFTENKIDQTKDMLWCRRHFTDKRNVFISGIDYMGLFIMSMCSHHVIANSSFSWWGSYLCTNEDQIICSPKEWFLDKEYPKPFMCNNWVLIDN